MEASCPHCHAPLHGTPGRAGEIVDCAHCDRSFVMGRAGAVAPAAAGRGAEEPAVASHGLPAPLAAGAAQGAGIGAGRRGGSPSEVRLSITGVAALAGTLVFYLAIVRPLVETSFGQLFGARGWVPYVISFLTLWSGVLLGAKYVRLSRQQRVLELDLLPRSIARRVTPETAPAFLAYLRQLPGELADGFLVRRIVRSLEHFCSRANVVETVDQLRSQGRRDEAVVESSYTMLRVFIWAIPILGFIGTVLGIGASVGGFSDSVGAASDLEVMKDSIGTVTSGLGVAFDTTLLALVMSIFIMFPTSSLQKAEEDYLARVDDYCHQHLVARLDAGEAGEGAVADELMVRVAERLADELVAALERRRPKVH